MDDYKLLISVSSQWTKLLLLQGSDELLKARLPPAAQVRHERAATTLLEGLSLWLDTRLPVALSVDARDVGFCLGLTDEMGIGQYSVYYRVEAVAPHAGRRRGIRIPGVGDFRDFRQLRLWSAGKDPR